MVPHHSLTHAFEEIYFTQAWLLCLCVPAFSLIGFTCSLADACASVWKHVWVWLRKSHPPARPALNIIPLGTLRVNAWNLRHVQYRESCKERGKKTQAVVWQLLCLFSILWCHSVCEGVHASLKARVCVGVHSACLCPYESIRLYCGTEKYWRQQ